ncbi:TPA: tyrosine-protein kinase, partial [Klebsiella pneumoniae]|nr:tyrosine-protein kinase [Klebsiella pneumoniae]
MTSVINNKMAPQDGNEIDFGRLVGEVIDHRKLIVAITTGFTVIAVLYSLLATPIYQANALIQVEQKQGNAILSSLSQILPDGQPQSAPEISLLQSRMILGKTVDELALQAQITPKYFPLIGKGLARIMGKKTGEIALSQINIANVNSNEATKFILTVKDEKNYTIEGDGFKLNGTVGTPLYGQGISLLVSKIDAEKGSQFEIEYISKLKAITLLQDSLSVVDQGKDTGMLSITFTDENPALAERIIDSISQNYLTQNIARQAAQDAKSLEFLNQQLPIVRNDLDNAEDKLNAYRKQRDSVDLTMEAKTVLD